MVMKRLEYMDCLRGMVMLMVVFCHTCGEFCLGCKGAFWLSSIFGILMLPGFFFLGLKLYGLGGAIDLHTQWLLMMAVASVLTICVTYASLAMAKVIGLSKLMSKLLIGK